MNAATAPPLARGKDSALRLRLISALVLVPPALAAAWFGWPWLPALTALAAAGMGWEWARLACAGRHAAGALAILTPLCSVAAAALGWTVAALGLALLGSAAVWIAAGGSGGLAGPWASLGTAWIALPCIAVLWIAAEPQAGRAAVLWLLATVWAADTGAYVAGRGLGGPRLAPRLSPNKTWAGFCGGVVSAGLVALVAAHYATAAAVTLAAVGLALGAAAQLGDLAESAAKRHFGVKDSSGLIPGHGGLLDRLDGMLAAAMLLSLLTLAAGASPLLWRG